MTTLRLMLLGLAALAACGRAGAAPDAGAPQDPLSQRMRAADRRLKTRGYTPGSDPFRSFLIEGQADVHPLSLRGGRCVALVGTSSEALQDLEVALFDGAGQEVAREDARLPSAVLQHCPSHGGPHYLVVRAAAGNGIYLVRRYDSPPGLGGRLDDLFLSPMGEDRASQPEAAAPAEREPAGSP